jgi:hypothetical protein
VWIIDTLVQSKRDEQTKKNEKSTRSCIMLHAKEDYGLRDRIPDALLQIKLLIAIDAMSELQIRLDSSMNELRLRLTTVEP